LELPLFLYTDYRISLAYLLLFLYLFTPQRYKKLPALLIIAACFGGVSALDYFMVFRHAQGASVPITLLECLIVQATAFLLAKYRDFRALCSGLFSAVYVLPGNVIASAIYVTAGRAGAALATQAAVHTVILFLAVHYFRRAYLLSQEEMPDIHWGNMCLQPAFYYMATYALTVWPINIYRIHDIAIPVLIVMIPLSLSLITNMHILTRERKEMRLEQQNTVLCTYRDGMKKGMEILEETEEKTAILRHDLRHKAVMANAYIEEGEYEKLRELLRETGQTLDRTVTERFCNNVAVNGVLAIHAEHARKAGIRFDCMSCPIGKLGVPEEDFATAVSNLVENAVHAAEKTEDSGQRTVKVRIIQVKGQLLTTVVNPYAGRLKISSATGLPSSEDGSGHGFGLISVQKFAEDSHAVFDYSAENGIFTARLLVPCGTD
jgi:signal transduction histidine kinase